jgi:regulator of chromosome condensation
VDFGAAHAGKRATFTASGRYATAATLDTGEVLAWGLVLCGAGKDALADPAKAAARLLANPLEAATPRSVVAPGGDGSPDDGTNLFLSDRAVAVDIGYVHAVVLTESGRVFSCDTGFDGYAGGLSDAFAPNGQHQLGRVAASPAAALAPGLVEFPFPKRLNSSVKATEPTSGGAGEDAPRSKDDDDDDDDDEEDENKIVAVAAGRCHGAAVDAGGRAYFFGCGALGGVTAGGRENEGLPRLVDDAILRGRAVVDVAAGEHFTLASAADGGMVGWGDGNSGQLGLDADALDRERRRDGDDGRNANAPGPAGGAVEVPMGEGARVVAPVAGYQHALAIVAKEAPRRRR